MKHWRTKKKYWKKINEVKIGRKQEEVVMNLEKFYNFREEVINFFKDYVKMILDAGYKEKQDGTKQNETK